MKKLFVISFIVMAMLSNAYTQPMEEHGAGLQSDNPELHQRDRSEERGFGALLKDPKLQLTEKQLEVIKNLYKEHRLQSVEFRSKMKKFRIESEDEFNPKTFSPDVIRQNSKKRHEMMQHMMNNRLEFVLSIVEVLDKKQKEYVLPKLQGVFMGPPMKEGRHPGKRNERIKSEKKFQ